MSGLPRPIPPPVTRVLERLEATGHEAFLVGAGVRALLGDGGVWDFEIATSAPGDAVLRLLPEAVLTEARSGRAMVPTEAGPVDVLPYAGAASIEEVLAQRDFTLHAIALSAAGRVTDPFDGCADADKALLRSVGPAPERLAEDPLRALRAARLVATQDLEIDPALAAALPAARAALLRVPVVRLREELAALLLGPWVSRGLQLLRASGLEATLAPGVAPHASGIVRAVPADLELRLAAWLLGTRAVSILRRLRFPRPQVVAVERMLQLHPIDGGGVRPQHDARIRRLARRSPSRLRSLLALREAEIEARAEGPAARERLAQLRTAVLCAEREGTRPSASLALDGRAVIEILGCRPGPAVGRALRHLAEVVATDPGCNDPETLRERLLSWWKTQTPDPTPLPGGRRGS